MNTQSNTIISDEHAETNLNSDIIKNRLLFGHIRIAKKVNGVLDAVVREINETDSGKKNGIVANGSPTNRDRAMIMVRALISVEDVGITDIGIKELIGDAYPGNDLDEIIQEVRNE